MGVLIGPRRTWARSLGVVLSAAALAVWLSACSGTSPSSSSATGGAGSGGSTTSLAGGGGPDGLEPPPNPFLADSPWPASHRGPYNQASSPLPGPTEANLTADLIETAPVAITWAYGPTQPDGSASVWGSTFSTVAKAVAAPDGTLTLADQIDDPTDLPAAAGLTGSITAAYTLVGADGTFYAARGRRISSYRDAAEGDPRSPIATGATLGMDGVLGADDSLVALSMTWDGTLVAASRLGTVLAVSRDLRLLDQVTLPGGEEISNSVAVDEDGGIYVTTSGHQHRVQWTGTALSTDQADGAWSAAYDPGPATPGTGRLGTGSGTTPSLMGTSADPDRLVIIADGAELMHLVAFWRDAIPDGWKPIAPGRDPRIAAEVTITFGDPAATRSITEQSPVIRGYDTMVVSNAYGPPFDQPGDNPVQAIISSSDPAVAPHGAELFRWDPERDELTSVWSNPQVSCPNGIPSMSAATGLAYCYGARDGHWTLEALRWDTGDSVFAQALSSGTPWNSFYAATEIGPSGTIVSGTFGGVVDLHPS